MTTERTLPSASRRALLAGFSAGAATAAAAGAAAAGATVLQPAERALAQDAPPSTPAMRKPMPAVNIAAAGDPALPPAENVALNRMAFGPRPGDISAVRAMGGNDEERIAAYAEQQLNPGSIDDSQVDARLAALGLTTLGKSRAQLWTDHIAKEGIPWEERIRPVQETAVATFTRAVYSKRQLVEVLADFWHNHFNVYGWDYWSAGNWVYYDRDVIRAHVFGNFRQMIGAVAQSAPMLYYLDNVSNTSAGPNENYARELFELHGLGAENYLGVASTVGPNGEYRHPAPTNAAGVPMLYVDEDIYSATQCFTGWRVHEDTGNFIFEDSVHAKYSKIVLAHVIPSGMGQQDGETVLDLIASHPGTAHYICRKLCRRLIADTPPERIVQAAAEVFLAERNAPDQLRKVVRTILLAPEFRSTWGQKIKRPFDFVISLLRTTNADFAWSSGFDWMFDGMGQPIFGWRPPNGFPDMKENWSSTMPMLQRWRMTNWLINWWTYGGDGANKDDHRIDIVKQTPTSVTTANALVDFWMARILARDLPATERAPIVDFMAAGRNADTGLPREEIDDRVPHMVSMILMSPSFQWR